MRFVILALFISFSCTGAATAQSSKYSAWTDPNGQAAPSDASVQELIGKLNKLIDDAEKARAANPVFLQDLRNLANSYTTPWSRLILNDAFTDGDFTDNPSWQVLSGEYLVEQGWGLRNRILTAQQQTDPNSSSGNNDLAKVLIGTILKRAAGLENQQTSAGENAIAARIPISNAFSIAVEFSSWAENNHFEVGVFQGQAAQTGYRLLYVGGKGLQLHRIGATGSSVVKTSAKALSLEDKKFHKLAWTRTADGQMKVSVDGEELISVVDRDFSDPFDGIRFSDKGGDFIIKQVSIHGV